MAGSLLNIKAVPQGLSIALLARHARTPCRAQVMSIDGFAAFQELGMSATAAIAKEGLRYRNTILSMGGARAPGLVFEVSTNLQCIAMFIRAYCVR